MDEHKVKQSLASFFGQHILEDPALLAECLSILRLYALPADELFFKWEAFILNHLKPLKSETTVTFTLENAKELHKEIQREALARASGQGAKSAKASAGAPTSGATKRHAGVGGLDFLDFNPSTPPAKKPRPSNLSSSATIPSRLPNSSALKQPKQEPHPSSSASSPFSATTPRLEGYARVNALGKPPGYQATTPTGTKGGVFSSPSISNTPSGPNSFHNRPNALSVTDTLNHGLEMAEIPAIPLSATSAKGRITFSAGADPKDYAYRYMFEKVSERSEMVETRINDVTNHLLSLPNATEPLDPSIPSTTTIFTVGQLTTDSESTTQKLNDHSVVLQTSRIVGAGARVPLRFAEGCKVSGGPSGVSAVGLFTGQVLGFKGRNGSGREFWVDEVLVPPPPPFSSTPASEILEMQHGSKMASKPVSVFAASGPFTLDTDLEFAPFDALVDEVKRCRPDCLILMGPFLSASHPLIKSGKIDQSPVEIFKSKIAVRLQEILENVPGSQIVLVPSVKDLVTNQMCFPQGMFERDAVIPSKRVRLLPNPCLININEVSIGISTVDTLFHLRKETFFKKVQEAKRSVGEDGKVVDWGMGDLMAGVCRNLLSQRSFYPMYPVPQDAASDVNLDLTHYDLLKMEISPDILLLPSNLGKFAKIVDSVVVINPGRLTQRTSGGTFSKFVIHPIDHDRLVQAAGKNGGEGEPMEHEAYERVRVDIVRI